LRENCAERVTGHAHLGRGPQRSRGTGRRLHHRNPPDRWLYPGWRRWSPGEVQPADVAPACAVAIPGN